MMELPEGFRPIREVGRPRYGTVADLRMASGRTYRAVWGFRRNICAWWPLPDQAKRSPIPFYGPVALKVVADGIVPSTEWRRAVECQHAVFS